MNYEGIGQSLSAVVFILVLLTAFLYPLRAHAAEASDVTAKLHVLNELGIEFSEETQLYIQQFIDDAKATFGKLGLDVAQYTSYPIILSTLGVGKYDKASQSFTPFTNSVYAFDAECGDISEAYGDFLFAVSRISNDEIQIEDYSSNVDEATFEAGTGTQEVAFKLNGKPYHFLAQFHYDWLDCTIIDYVNSILDEQSVDKRLWCMFDGGQGFVVFYNTPEWAKEFLERTGYSLATKANGALQ